MVKSNQELIEFIKSLRNEFPTIIENYKPVIFLNVFKVKYLPKF